MHIGRRRMPQGNIAPAAVAAARVSDPELIPCPL